MGTFLGAVDASPLAWIYRMEAPDYICKLSCQFSLWTGGNVDCELYWLCLFKHFPHAQCQCPIVLPLQNKAQMAGFGIFYSEVTPLK